jgi:ATP-dependent DNA ligase
VPLAFIHPLNPTTGHFVPSGDDWLHEPKLDGYRLQVIKEGRTVRLYSGWGSEWTEHLSPVSEALRAIPCRSAILDAELCFLSVVGMPDFYGLSAAIRRRRQPRGLAVYAFDLLHRDGRDLRPLPLTKRRRRLERLMARSDVPCLRLVETFANGKRLLDIAERLHLEGIVSKRKASRYHSGPSREWRIMKTKTWREFNRERWRLFERP